jgi:Domain of unknown function (DUF1708)
MQTTTSKVVMIVESVSPTPFSLLRRARNFEYRDDDRILQEFSKYDDPVRSLTDECRRVLECISSTNQSSHVPANGTAAPDASWSRFEDMGFSNFGDNFSRPGDLAVGGKQNGMRGAPLSLTTDMGRPTTPSWADFLNTGFPDDRRPTLLPPDKQLHLAVGGARGHSSQSHRPGGAQADLEPGELASIAHFDLDETFWWVWMTSLAGEEPAERKAVFGRCALIETTEISGNPWLLIEEQIKGASPGQEEGAYIAEKKSRFSFTRRGRLGRRKTTVKKDKKIDEPYDRAKSTTPSSKIGPEQHAKIQQAAAQLARGKAPKAGETLNQRNSRLDEEASNRNSMLSIGPLIQAEASTALQWTSKFDSGTLREKEDLRALYLNDRNAGTGRPVAQSTSAVNLATNGHNSAVQSPLQSPLSRELSNRDLPALPRMATQERVALKSPTPPSTPPKQSRTDLSKPLFADEKLPAPKPDEHPAYRSPTVAEPTKKVESPVQVKPRLEATKISPKQEHKKLQKKDASSGTGGFKRLFGRKKAAEKETVQDTRPKISAPIPIAEPTDAYDSPPQSVHNDEPTFMEPPYESPVRERDEARQAALDKLEADREFSRFDQGPLDDVPAFVPEPESDDEAAPPPIVKPAHNTRVAALSPPEDSIPRSRSPQASTKLAPPPVTADDQSEQSIEVAAASMSASDRWAQIRKNAAERAQRQLDVQHGRKPSENRSDDGETSGEETIESRVARIKARVAELTGTYRVETLEHKLTVAGNMESGSTRA